MHHQRNHLTIVLATLFFLAVVLTTFADAQQPAEGETSALLQRQTGVAERYSKLEELLLRLADVEADENPERAALLRRAARQSRDKFTLEKLRSATQSLQTQQYQNAVERQSEASEGMEQLLTLLLSEDRSKRIRDEKERVQRMIKDLKRIERAQRSTRARTENDADMNEVEKEQEAITERAEELNQELAGKEESDGEPKDGEPKDGEPKDGEPKDGEPKDSEPKDSQQSPSESQSPSSENSEPSESGSQAEQQPQSPQQQAEQQLQKAIEKMQQAEKKLEEAKREEATDEQSQAEQELRAAIDSLEQILRQLREEELQRELARIEARLKKMAAMQSKVLDDTVTLAATPKIQRNRQTDLKAGDLAFEEKKITLEADRAMLLLREEGSSVAFPEVVEQIRSDTTKVAERLAETKIDTVTQGIQKDILAALEEMIAALQKAQRDLEQKKQQQQPGQPEQGQQGEQPLVEALAELKLIRTMETRIKSTTERYAGMLEAGETTGDDVLPLLQSLSERQNRLYQITRDLVLKRNQ